MSTRCFGNLPVKNIGRTTGFTVAVFLIGIVMPAVAGWSSASAGAAKKTELSAEVSLPSGSSRRTLRLSSVRAVNSSLTIPPNVSLRLDEEGTFDVQEGATLTINGPMDAPLEQVFRGSGKVVFGPGSVDRVYPQWWGAKPDDHADDTSAIQAAIDSIPNGGVVLFPPGRFDISSSVRFREGVTLEGVYGRSTLYSAKGVPAILQRPDTTPPPPGIHFNVATRLNGIRIARLNLDGGPRDSEVGLDLANVGYSVIEDVNVQHCRKGFLMGELCIYNNIINPGIGSCETAIEVNIGTMQNNIFGGHIGAVKTGILANVTNALNIYGMSFDAYTTGVEVRRGDSVNMYSLYFDSIPPAVSIRIAPQVHSCTIINPRFSGPTPKAIDNQSDSTLVLDASYDVNTTLASDRLTTKVLHTGGISATNDKANNLRGQALLSGNESSVIIHFPVPEPDHLYFAVATCVATTGNPPTEARHVSIKGKAKTGFGLCLDAAPGLGNSVTVDWILIR